VAAANIETAGRVRANHAWSAGETEQAVALAKAVHYRTRAQELRKIAKGIFDHEERKKLIEIADEYEQFGRKAERK
jgi:hypothetical protein